MTASDGFLDLLRDTLSGLGPVSVRRMFGGAGIYADGVMFALVADDTLYLKADDETKRAFEDEGLNPFAYEAGGRTIALSYWRVPERLFDDPDEMTEWACIALSVARRSAARKTNRARSSPAPGKRRSKS